MCIAIPYGQENTNESKVWRLIRTRPLYMLGLGAILQLLFLALFWLLLKSTGWPETSLQLEPSMITLYSLLLGVVSFIFFALTMHYYRKKMISADIEYLYYGAFFFLASYNMGFFFIASFMSHSLIITSIIIQFSLLFFAFRPLWRAYYWADKQHKRFTQIINFVFFILLLCQLLFVVFYLFPL